MKKFLTAISISLLLLASSGLEASAQHAGVIHLDDNSFDNGIKSGYVLVDFWATWCPPCRMLSPVIEEIAYDFRGKVAVAKVDVDKAPDTAKKFAVSSIPTLILFKDGKAVKGWMGYKSKEELTTLIEKEIR